MNDLVGQTCESNASSKKNVNMTRLRNTYMMHLQAYSRGDITTDSRHPFSLQQPTN